MIRAYGMADGKIVQVDGVSEGSWIRVTSPDYDEIAEISRLEGLDISEISASLDRDEGSRFEIDDGVTTIIVDIPYRRGMPGKTPFDTLPLAIMLVGNKVMTVCQLESDVISKVSDGQMKGTDLNNPIQFILKLLYNTSLTYQQYLREINTRRREIEDNINRSNDDDIIELHKMESSLVYFSTSLHAMNAVLSKMKRDPSFDSDLTDDMFQDVTIENQQAIEMVTIYREIIDGTRDLFVAIMNNNLNDTMKWLTAITLILSIPMIIGGLYGMNVSLPYSDSPYAFTSIIVGLVLLCVALGLYLRRKGML